MRNERGTLNRYVWLLVLLLWTGLLPACGSGGSSGSSTGPTVVPGNGSITLSWDSSAPLIPDPGDTEGQTALASTMGYKIYYGTVSGTYGQPIDIGSKTTYTVSGLLHTTKYYFVVTAYNGFGESDRSNEISATTL